MEAPGRSAFSAYTIVIGMSGLLLTGCVADQKIDPHPPYVQFNENIAIGTTLFNLTARDPVNQRNQMTFKPNSLETAEYVNILQTNLTNPKTANITLKKGLDRELQEGGIELKFSLVDMNGNTMDTSIRLYILDVCDEYPLFNTSFYTTEIEETNVNESRVIYTEILATDKDNGVNAIVYYTMEPKAESSYWRDRYRERFSIDLNDGHILLKQNLDYENNSFYQFTIHAQDSCNLTAKPADLIIRVKDVQDTPPFFTGLPYMQTIPEGNHTNIPLLQITAFDGDRGIPNEIYYVICKGNGCTGNTSSSYSFCDTLFNINDSTGEIRITGNLDWAMQEVQNISGICTIIVEAIEKDTNKENKRRTSNTTVTVTILDENNHLPMFENELYYATVQENAAPNTAISLDGRAPGIKVYDKDKQGIHSTFGVKLVCDNQVNCSTFGVVPSAPITQEGVIIIRVVNNSLLDYEQRHNITIIVIATEVENSSRSVEAKVMVQIQNENEYRPCFKNNSYEACIIEEPDNGTSVINITAIDHDAELYSEVSYSLSGGNSLFSVNNKTGQIVTNCKPGDLDREKLQKFYLSITATDGGGLISQTQLIVNLRDKNDNPPTFQQKVYAVFLIESSTVYVSKSFLSVQATDADDPNTNNSKVSYEIRNISNSERNFTINSKTGMLNLAYPLDYEALTDAVQGIINVTVFAHDHGNPQLSGNATVSISVQDINDNAPVFSDTHYFSSIKENVKDGTYVGKVNATDADKTERNNQISFAIQAGGFDNFRIDGTTGNVTVQVGAHFDRDIINLYNLTIIAIDQGANPFTTTTTMSVKIEDINNKPPKFNQSNYHITALEDMKLGSILTTCVALDPDENQSLSYGIQSIMGWNESGGNVKQSQSYIGINEVNGTLFVKSALDRETMANIEIHIFVNDTGAEENMPQNATATVTITVLDVDDNPPRFIQRGDLRVGMKRNMEPDKVIFELKSRVTDKDTSPNGIDKWIFEKLSFEINSDLKNKLNGLNKGRICNDPVCVTGNGTIINNMYYTQDMSGFFNVTVLVRDDAGNDTDYILIFLITDSQVLKMTINGIRTNVAMIKDKILSDCSNVTGLLFVYDSIADHKTNDGTVDTFKTDLFFHIQDRMNNTVLSSEEAKRLLDEYADKLYVTRMTHNIISIESSLKSDNPVNESTKTIYVMAAVIALLTLVVLIVGYMFFSSSNRYKRKLRAAMPPEKEVTIKHKDDFIVPGSNIYAHRENPLLNTPHAPPGYEDVDATSQNSLDKNDVDDIDDDNIYKTDELEEREVTLDMYGEEYYTQMSTEDPLESALREHDAQKQASIQKLDNPRIDNSTNEDDEEMVFSGCVNNAFHHNLQLETSEI